MVPVTAAIFDLDQTLLDTDALRHAREQRAWSVVSKGFATVKPFQSDRFGETDVIMSAGRSPTIHWGSILRLDADRYALGRYFISDDRRCEGHGLSRLVLSTKRSPSGDAKVAAIFEAFAAQVPLCYRPELIVSVPPAPGDSRDRFAVARAALVASFGARDGGEVLKMSHAVDNYKHASRAARGKLNADRFRAESVCAERALLIDDVLTSGGQSAACRKALRVAGCGSTTVVTLSVTQDRLPEECPSCGSSLVKRVRRRDGSQFFGCTAYPACNYTRPLSARKRQGLSR
jgi:hypothetical protein